jgi:hypothetical protein
MFFSFFAVVLSLCCLCFQCSIAGEDLLQHNEESKLSVFQNFARVFSEEEDPSIAIKYLEDNIRTVASKRKRIEITCPGPDPPIVGIADMEEEENNDANEYFEFDDEDTVEPSARSKPEKDTCFHLSVKGKNFEMNLDLNC